MKLLTLVFTSLFITACAGQPNSQECSTGITCPEGTRCAAVQAVCITNSCGDGLTDSTVGEVCDDGNIEDGDGCAANCQSRETCGDGVLNASAGELCDDGNTTGGDGCSADCRSVEICGNNVRDVNEACDDGNTVPGDGCSGNCKSTEVCGNNIVDLNEKCDDGGAAGGCNDDCQGGTGCGDGAIDRDGSGNALEECDDGNSDINDDCVACKLNVCGDGIINVRGSNLEQCDGTAVPPAVAGDPVAPGTGGETAGCNLDCTVDACGDNKINNTAGEECDDGSLNADNRDCTAACQVNRCGDTLANTLGPTHTEGCDDGNANQLDGCSTACTLPTCGNGIREMNEQCDDTNTTSGDGCSSSCQRETCGDGRINNGEQCDGTGTASVTGTPGETPTCDVDCSSRSCGDGLVNKTAGEECDDMNANDSGDSCRNNCKLNVCGDGSKSGTELCDDGNTNNNDGCTTSCTTPTCGNGIVDMTEQCDDGNSSNTDGCLNSCVYAACGDGFTRTGVEECDNGAGNGDQKNCLLNCKINVCGDGHVDQEGTGAAQTEACDDGNTQNETSCPYGIVSCTLCDSTCDNPEPLTGNICGDGAVDAGHEQCDDSNTITETACAYNTPGGTCNICSATCQTVAETGPYCGDGTTDGSFGEVCDDRNANACGTCNSICSIASTAKAATGLIIAVDNSGANTKDGDTFVISDGLVPVTFEFDKNSSVGSGNVAIDVSGTLTAKQVRDLIAAAIASAKSSKNLRINTTDAADTGLVLTNIRLSSIGNVAIDTSNLSSAFFVSGMSDGAAGDCGTGVACKSDNDCLAANGTGVGKCTSNACE